MYICHDIIIMYIIYLLVAAGACRGESRALGPMMTAAFVWTQVGAAPSRVTRHGKIGQKNDASLRVIPYYSYPN